jgi:glycosyltransferase involved in cell wall biosynthesis
MESCRRIRAFHPDLVCISQGSNVDGLHWMEWCRSEGIPYVSVMQANAEHLWPVDGLADALAAAHLQAVASCFVSKANLHLFEKQIGFQLPNSRVVRNPFNVPFQAAPTWPPSEVIFKLACVGRLCPMAKGQDLILETLALPAWRNRPISVSLVGSGEMERSLRRLAARLGVEEKVAFRGQLGSIEGVWAEHHALLLPSRYEGLPLALVEAMLCHRMAIVTDVAGHSEVLEDGLHGFVAQAPTVPALADAMERAWQRRPEWQQIGLAAGQHIRALVPESPASVFALWLTELLEG